MLTKTLGKSRFQIGGNVSNPDAADFTLCQSTMELLAGEGSETKRTDLGRLLWEAVTSARDLSDYHFNQQVATVRL